MALTPGSEPAPSEPGQVAERLERVRARILNAGGDLQRVAIVAVTKGQPMEAAASAVAAGLDDLGENFADDLLAKAAIGATERRWHFLGHVQRNKVSRLAGTVHLWQGVDRLAAGAEIARRSPGARVLVQVNVTAEPQKNGCRPDEAGPLVDALGALGLDVLGLMTVGHAGPPEMARAGFRTLTEVADRLALDVRSMGMSDDLDVAVQEGATMVRVGRALFGSGARRL